ncbi:MAG: hypothetical protein ABSG65_33095 [Bryobacteraceae bacterium]|jgi:hypothetical protein
MPIDKASMQALKNILTEIDLLVSTSPQPMPQNRTPRCLELTKAALALVDDVMKQTRTAPAAILGHKGGSTTAKRHGAEHYRLMAAARKTHAGGRPRKQAE